LPLRFPDSADSADLAAAGYSQVIILGGGNDSVSTSVTADYLILAGGGGGGGTLDGGGGAGGYRTSWGTGADGSGGYSGGNSSLETALTLNNGIPYSITVGQGGEGGFGWTGGVNVVQQGHVGRTTSISGSDITTVTTVGGGGGSYHSSNSSGTTGGSGGGGGINHTPGSGTTGEGTNGGAGATVNSGSTGSGGGGGGASTGGSAGGNTVGGDGGDGLASTITGISITRAGGGGGGQRSAGNSTTSSSGGDGGGGSGGWLSSTPTSWNDTTNTSVATHGRAKYGAGGGGGGYSATFNSLNGGNGGSGIAIFRLPSTVTYSASQLDSDVSSLTNCTASYLNTQVYTDDTNFADVTLLLDGSSTTDKSSANTGLNNNGVAVNQNSQSHPYASGVLLFDGTDDLTIPTDNANLYLGTEDWTIEGWFRTTNLGTTNTILEYRTSGNDNGVGKMFIGVQSNGQVGIYENTVYQAVSATGAITTNTWYHLAFQRSGGTVSVFINGSLVDSGSLSSSTVDILGPSNRPIIGGYTGGNYNWIGEWADFRVTKGYARYSGSFTPPTSALSADVSGITGSDDVVLLLDGESYTDQSSSPLTVDETGGDNAMSLNTTTYKFGSSSYYFGDDTATSENRLYVQDASLAMGTGDFTYECWIYPTHASDDSILETRSSGASGISDGFTLTAITTTSLRVWSGGAARITSGTISDLLNNWHHVAVVRSSGTTTLFVNGVSQGSTTYSMNCTNNDIIIGMGRYGGSTTIAGGIYGGYIDDVRITKGAALYPQHPPISALTNDDTWDKPKNNFSIEGNITADDQLLDTPNLRFASLDPDFSGGGSGQTLSEGNLKYYCPVNTEGYFAATESKTSGKWYFEMLYDGSTNNTGHGIVGWTYTDMSQSTASTTINPLDQDYGGMIQYSRDQLSDPVAVTIDADASVTFTSPSTAPNDIFGIAFDADTRTIWFSVNNTWFSGDPGTGQSPSYSTLTSGKTYIPFIGHFSNNASRKSQAILNFGQDHTFAGAKSPLLTPYSDANGVGEFYYQPPSGFLALAQKYS